MDHQLNDKMDKKFLEKYVIIRIIIAENILINFVLICFVCL